MSREKVLKQYLDAEYRQVRDEMKELLVAKGNVDHLLMAEKPIERRKDGQERG